MSGFFLSKLNEVNEIIFAPADGYIQSLLLPEPLTDALIDSFHMLPFLLFVFVFIEIFEFYYSDKTVSFTEHSEKFGPLVGAIVATVPQCGFSVMAATLYAKKFISPGTLLAVFISTSDEALPVLSASPESLPLILPLISVKIILAVFVGYLTDMILKRTVSERKEDSLHEKTGCCCHKISSHDKKELWLHPLTHTFNIFLFIFLITLCLNYMLSDATAALVFENKIFNHPVIQATAAGIFGLIPNCAVSVGLTFLYIKNIIESGSVLAGLSTGAGLGLLVLFRKNKDIKDSIFITGILASAGICTGIVLNILF